MTPEERARMNDLCVQIQNETKYSRFEELKREVTALMYAKESRFPESKLSPAGMGQKTLRARAVRTMKGSTSYDTEVVELHLSGAEPLYSEIRIENSFVDERGNAIALQPPAHLDVKFQAPGDRFTIKPPGPTTP